MPTKPSFNLMAIASLVAGLFGLTGFGSLLAIVFGWIALVQIKRTNERGRGLAIFGIILGLVQAVLVLILLLVFGVSFIAFF